MYSKTFPENGDGDSRLAMEKSLLIQENHITIKVIALTQ